MKKFSGSRVFSVLVLVFTLSVFTDIAMAQGLLGRNSEPSGLQQQELDDAYYRGYNDAKSGKGPMNYTSDGPQNNGEVIRGAGRGALGGAAIGKLSDGDVGHGAAWGAGAGAIKGAVQRRREAAEEGDWAAKLNSAYNEGYRKGMEERGKSKE